MERRKTVQGQNTVSLFKKTAKKRQAAFRRLPFFELKSMHASQPLAD